MAYIDIENTIALAATEEQLATVVACYLISIGEPITLMQNTYEGIAVSIGDEEAFDILMLAQERLESIQSEQK